MLLKVIGRSYWKYLPILTLLKIAPDLMNELAMMIQPIALSFSRTKASPEQGGYGMICMINAPAITDAIPGLLVDFLRAAGARGQAESLFLSPQVRRTFSFHVFNLFICSAHLWESGHSPASSQWPYLFSASYSGSFNLRITYDF